MSTATDAGKSIIHGYRALHAFFEAMQGGGEPRDIADKVRQAYPFTAAQQACFQQVLARTETARGIVRYLEQRFGTNEYGVFNDPASLYRALHPGKKVPKHLEAHSYRIGIGIYKSPWHIPKKVMGRHEPNPFDQLAVPLEQTIARLDAGQKTGCEALTYTAPDVDTCERILQRFHQIPTHPVLAAVAALRYHDYLDLHEFRHVIDSIIGAEVDFFTETQAELYSDRRQPLRGLDRDFKKFEERCAHNLKTADYLSNTNIPTLQKVGQQSAARNQARIKAMRDLRDATLEQLKQIPPTEYPALSYLFSTAPQEEIPAQLALVAASLKRDFAPEPELQTLNG